MDLIALLILAPVVVPVAFLVAVAVFLDSPGGVLYRASRIGIRGREFTMFKFRTMKVGQPGNAIASGADLRITPVGRFLRATRLDELPQLLNVLRGEMSMVGPRPELREFVELHADDYREILTVPPGITGPTQLRFAGVEASLLSLHDDPDAYYRDNLLPDKVKIDLDYVHFHSNGRDLKALFQTLVLPLILVWQAAHGDVSARGRRRSAALASFAVLAALLPIVFALGLGSPR